MKVIGITGTSGSGKTTISQILDRREDIKIINADKMAKEMTELESEYFMEIKNAFKEDDIILDNKKLNRKKLAKLIYNNQDNLKKLNQITFKFLIPKIIDEINNISDKIKMVVIDAPLLFESGLDRYCDCIITFDVPYQLKIDRICRRDNIEENIAKDRLKIQNDNEFYMKKSNYIIINDENTTLNDLERKVNEIINKIERD